MFSSLRFWVRDEVLVAWVHEAGRRRLATTKRLILLDMLTVIEFEMISANRTMELILFACHLSMLWPPVGCGYSDATPPLYSGDFAAAASDYHDYYQALNCAIDLPAAASDDDGDNYHVSCNDTESELPSRRPLHQWLPILMHTSSSAMTIR